MSFRGDRLRHLREKDARLSREQLAEDMSTTVGTITNWELARANPGPDDIVKLANKFETTTDYLLGATDERAKVNGVTDRMPNDFAQMGWKPMGPVIFLPVYGKVYVNKPHFRDGEIIAMEAVPTQEFIDGMYWIEVKDDSLLHGDLIPNGARVLVVPQDKSTKKQIAVVLVEGKEVELLRHVEIIGEQAFLHASNIDYPTESYPVDAIHIIGVVVKHVVNHS